MDPSTFLAAYDADVRQTRTLSPGDRLDVSDGVFRLVGSHANHSDNCVRYAACGETEADALVQEQLRFFREVGHPFYWKVYDHDRPADLAWRLEAAGFRKHAESCLVVQDPGQVVAHEPPAGVRVSRLTDPAQLRDLARVQEAVWNEDCGWLVHGLGSSMRETPDRLSVFLAYAGDEPVACGWTKYFGGEAQFAFLFGGSTLAEFRRRGIYKALVAARAAEAKRRKTPYMLVDAGSESEPILLRLGFQPMTRLSQWYSP